MDVFWDWHVAFGEFIGTFILTITILFSVLISKRKKFGLDTKWKRKGLQAAVIPASVVVGIVTAHMFGGKGFINPAITFIAGVMSHQFKGVWYICAAEMFGGIFAFIILILTVKCHDIGINKDDKIDLSKIFKYNNQKILKSQGNELLSNILWLLPIAGLLKGIFQQSSLNFGNKGFSSVYELAMVAALGLVVVILVLGEFGVANLNPAVWIGEFFTRIVSQKSITIMDVTKEILTAINALAVGAACGAIALIK